MVCFGDLYITIEAAARKAWHQEQRARYSDHNETTGSMFVLEALCFLWQGCLATEDHRLPPSIC